MRGPEAFERTEFLGTARRADRDEQRLAMIGAHLERDETPLAVLPLAGSTLVLSDRRLMELGIHLEVHGAWNVRRMSGFSIEWECPREDVTGADVVEEGPGDAPVGRITVETARGPIRFVAYRGQRTVNATDLSRFVELLTRRS